MINNEKDLRQVENLLRALNKASFPEMIGEEHLALAASWVWLRQSMSEYLKRKEDENKPKAVDQVIKSPESKRIGKKK